MPEHSRIEWKTGAELQLISNPKGFCPLGSSPHSLKIIIQHFSGVQPRWYQVFIISSQISNFLHSFCSVKSLTLCNIFASHCPNSQAVFSAPPRIVLNFSQALNLPWFHFIPIGKNIHNPLLLGFQRGEKFRKRKKSHKTPHEQIEKGETNKQKNLKRNLFSGFSSPELFIHKVCP